MAYKYFVVYISGLQLGNTEVITDCPIRDLYVAGQKPHTMSRKIGCLTKTQNRVSAKNVLG